jgi:hypothetical protein
MSRRNKAQKTMKGAAAQSSPLFSEGGKRIMAAGVALIALGLFCLSFTDALGRNWASVLAPFSILAGYAVVFLGIFWPLEGGQACEPASSSSFPNPPSTPKKPSRGFSRDD